MPQPVTSKLLEALVKKRDVAALDFAKRHEFAKEWLEKRGVTLRGLREHATKLLTGVTLSSALLLASPHIPFLGSGGNIAVHHFFKNSLELRQFLQTFSGKNSDKETEQLLTQNIEKYYGVRTAFELDNNRLPAYVGSMGLEQHLARFPGDTISQHEAFSQEGMAPQVGAFGYFSDTGQLTPKAETRERFYIVFRTFDVPNWNNEWKTLKNWYKFRKFLVLDPHSGRGVIAVLGDAGPAAWTGKQFGGSPEVMAGLGFYPGMTRGGVIVLFLDDPQGTIPPGPIMTKEMP